MKGFKKVVREVNETLNDIMVFETILNSILIFLMVYVILSISNLNALYALIPAIVYLIVVSYTKIKKNKAKIVEEKYDELNEKLRTAEDNISMENPIVDELQSEVIHDVRKVKASSFVNTRRVAYKITGCVILCFTIIFLATLNIHFFDFKVVFDKIPNYIIGDGEPSDGVVEGALGAGKYGGDDDIYGAESIAKIGDEELNIEIKSVNFEISVRNVKEAAEKHFDEQFPDEVFLRASEGATEDNIDDKELIKNYFLNLAKS